ncbi:MAG: hypothetical protein K1X89_29345 [Myxococcaceae bacterium]|nr:hypothetical protein [Myxococcaceae bacterium]
MSTSPLGKRFDKARTPEAFDKLLKSDSPAAIADAARFVRQLTVHSALEKKLTALVGTDFDTIAPDKLAAVKKLLTANEDKVKGFLEAAKSHHDPATLNLGWNYTTQKPNLPVRVGDTAEVKPLAKLDPLMDQPTLTGTLITRSSKDTWGNTTKELLLKTAQGTFALAAANPATYPYGLGAEISSFLAEATESGHKATVSVRGWMDTADPKKPIFVMERFCPGTPKDFISGRISIDGNGKPQMNVGGKMVHFSDRKLAALLKNYERAGLILPGTVENRGTVGKPNYVFTSSKPDTMYMLGALVSSATNYGGAKVEPPKVDAKRDCLVFTGISPGPATSQNPTTYYAPKGTKMSKYKRQIFEGTLEPAGKGTHDFQPRAFAITRVWAECSSEVSQYQGSANTPDVLDLARLS